MADLASIAAATSAGYGEIAVQRASGVWFVTLEKTVTGAAGQDIVQLRAHGEGPNQAAAETVALAALNAQRDERQRKTRGTVDVT